MMEQNDVVTLHKMQLEMDIKSTQNLDQVAEKLIALRDDLKFDDATWYNDLTKHLATLDSASTFRPGNNLEDKQVDLAIRHAVDELKKLIRSKID